MSRKRTPDPVWFDYVRVGDVLRFPNGSLRVVREVSRWTKMPRREGGLVSGIGPLRGVTFAIRQRSWTNRCYTVYCTSDLKTLGCTYVGARVKLDSDLDQCIDAAIHQKVGRPFILYAKHVRGVA